MTYSYTQISQYLTCPRRYRHRYLDGWQEKVTRAAMLFGRCFEQAVAALFRHEDPAAALIRAMVQSAAESVYKLFGQFWAVLAPVADGRGCSR